MPHDSRTTHMAARLLGTLAFSLLLPTGILPQRPSMQTREAVSKATLTVRVVIVADDLSLRPVPKKMFTLCRQPGCIGGMTVTTSFQGGATLEIDAGSHMIKSATPVDFEGKLYSWEVPFSTASTGATDVELSNDNATVTTKEETSPRAAVVTDEARLYQKLKSSVFKIESESGHGSGFLVDAGGLVLTNYHVVKGSSYLAIKTSPSEKYLAQLVDYDDTLDIAVLRVHPDAVKNLMVLRLAQDSLEHPPVSEGERVVAIGSPLMTEIQKTGGSALLAAIFGSRFHLKYRFKTDFKKMELVRDGVVIEPICQHRVTRVKLGTRWPRGEGGMGWERHQGLRPRSFWRPRRGWGRWARSPLEKSPAGSPVRAARR